MHKKLILMIIILCMGNLSVHGMDNHNNLVDVSYVQDDDCCNNPLSEVNCGLFKLYPYSDSTIRLNLYRLMTMCVFVAGVCDFIINSCESGYCIPKTVTTLASGTILLLDIGPLSCQSSPVQ